MYSNQSHYTYVRVLYTAPTGEPNNFSSIPNITSITVEWIAPDIWKRNGIITHYTIEWGETDNLTTVNYPVPNPKFNTTDDQTFMFTNLKSNTKYTFNIAAVNINGTGPVLNGMSTTLEEGIYIFILINIALGLHLYMATHTYVTYTYICM